MAKVSNEVKENETAQQGEHYSTYKVGITEDSKLQFPDLVTGNYFTKDELCNIANDIFSMGFADYAGCTIERNEKFGLHFRLFFTHEQHGKDETTAFEIGSFRRHSSNSALDRYRANDDRKINGDRFAMTDDAISAMDQYIVDRYTRNNKDGSFIFNRISSDISNRAGNGYYYKPITYSAIDFVDISEVLKEYFGDKDSTGSDIVYTVMPLNGAANMGPNQYMRYQEMYMVNRLNSDAVAKLANQVGMQTYSDSLNFVKVQGR